MPLQIHNFDNELASLQQKYGAKDLCFINGAGCINKPKLLLLFMNPTAKNVSANHNWQGMRAPWIGTKNVWKLLNKFGLLDDELWLEISLKKPADWTSDFAQQVYQQIANKGLYITNLAKCTQINAKHLNNSVFKQYLNLTLEEINVIKPKIIIAFGNQVSSILLNKPIKVSEAEVEELFTSDGTYTVYPSYYPVGQGMRNIKKAIERIKVIIDQI